MKFQNLFSWKSKNIISKCRLVKILPRVLSVKQFWVSVSFIAPGKPLFYNEKKSDIF